MSTSTLTSKGQITIPKQFRDLLGLEMGDQVVFVPEDGKLLLYPIRRAGLESLRGALRGPVPFKGRQIEREAAQRLAGRNALGSVED